MKTYSRQAGISNIGWLCVIVLVVFIAQLVIKLSPIYMEDYAVKSSLQQLAQTEGFTEMSRSQMRKVLSKKMYVNHINLKDKGVSFKRSDNKVLIFSDYEERISWFGNVDLVISFKHLLDSSRPQECC